MGFERVEDRKMEVTAVDLINLEVEMLETSLYETHCVPSHTWKHVAEFFEAKREIVVHGGEPKVENGLITNQLYALDVDTKTWRKLSYKGAQPTDQASHMSCLNATGDEMFVFASYYSDPTLSELYLFDYQGSVPCWELIKCTGNIPTGLYGGCLILVQGRYLFLFAGC